LQILNDHKNKSLEFTIDEIKSNNNYVLWFTCLMGQFVSFQWLLDTYEFSIKDLNMICEDKSSFHWICIHGYTDILQLCIQRFQLSPEMINGDIKANLTCLEHRICIKENEFLLDWIMTNIPDHQISKQTS